MTNLAGGAQAAGPKLTMLLGVGGVSAGLVGIAFFLLWSGVRQWRLGLDSEGWPATRGKVVTSGVTVIPGHGRNKGPRALAEVSYTYVVAGTSYTSDNISFGRAKLTIGSGLEDARTIVSAHPVGAPVTVHYRPGTPRVAVLEPGAAPGAVLRTLVGVLAGIAVFLLPLARGRRSLRRDSPASLAMAGRSQTHSSPKGGMTMPARFAYLFAMAGIAWSGSASELSADLPTLAAVLIVLGMLSAMYLNTAFRCGACGVAFGKAAAFGGWRSPPARCPSCGARL